MGGLDKRTGWEDWMGGRIGKEDWKRRLENVQEIGLGKCYRPGGCD